MQGPSGKEHNVCLMPSSVFATPLCASNKQAASNRLQALPRSCGLVDGSHRNPRQERVVERACYKASTSIRHPDPPSAVPEYCSEFGSRKPDARCAMVKLTEHVDHNSAFPYDSIHLLALRTASK